MSHSVANGGAAVARESSTPLTSQGLHSGKDSSVLLRDDGGWSMDTSLEF
ncbi:hypothetical protein WJR50_33880 [Catalinimonas sp. 4WD22]